MSKLEAALAYAERGCHVFPCVPGAKRPLVGGGFKAATLDPEQIRRWWTEHPDANIGIATGSISNLVVIDIDAPKKDKPERDGFRSFEQLKLTLGLEDVEASALSQLTRIIHE